MNKKELAILESWIKYADEKSMISLDNDKNWNYYLGMEIGLRGFLKEIRRKQK